MQLVLTGWRYAALVKTIKKPAPGVEQAFKVKRKERVFPYCLKVCVPVTVSV